MYGQPRKVALNPQDKKHPFAADRPIISSQGDLLDRGNFVRGLSAALESWQGKDSLVISLNGAWGSGKTSIKNLVLETLQKSKEDTPCIVEFNPWEWSGQDKLMDAFFTEVGGAIGVTNKDNKKLSNLWALHAERLRVVNQVVKGMHSGSKDILLLLSAVFGVSLLNALNSFPDKDSYLRVGAYVLILISGISWAINLAQSISSYLKAKSEYLKKSLQEIKIELSAEMAKLKKSVLVVIDDVDRLSASEIKILFQLIKANADFPNMVFLVLYQSDIVTAALKNTSPISSGEDFLKKIIQVELDIPKIEKSKIENILFNGLGNIVNKSEKNNFDQARWESIYLSGLDNYFNNLRDVFRFLGTLEFYFGMFQNKNILEVNSIDLIAIECIRVFDHSVYEELQLNKKLLTNPEKNNSADEEAISRLMKLSKNDGLSRVLMQLFPPIRSVVKKYEYDNSARSSWLADLRICHDEMFDKYFYISIPAGDISQAEIEEIITSSGDQDRLAYFFDSLNARGVFDATLQRLNASKERIPSVNATSFVTALFNMGEKVSNEAMGFFAISTIGRISGCVYWYLMGIKDLRRRSEVLLKAATDTTNLILPVSRASKEVSGRDGQNDGYEYLLSDVDAVSLKEICIEKIRRAASNGKLDSSNGLAHILFCWERWCPNTEVKSWVSNIVTSKVGFYNFLLAFTHKSFVQSYGEPSVKIRHFIKRSEIETFISLDDLISTGRSFLTEDLTENQAEAKKQLELAYERKKMGQQDDDELDG